VPKRPVAQDLLTLHSVVVSGHKGQPVRVDVEPRCPECGRMLGYLLARPWSLQCSRCKARLDSPAD
jgi:hypothetical protein